MNTILTRYKPIVDAYLQAFLQTKYNEFAADNLWTADVIQRLLPHIPAAKTLRGSLVMFASEACGRTPDNAVHAVAAGVELIHHAFVIHDDIMDRDEMRRGMPTIWKHYAARGTEHVGISQAISAGDATFFLAYQLFALGGKLELIDLLSREYQAVTAGQMTDVASGAGDTIPAEEVIRAMYRLKTARYSFSVPLTAGALLAEAPGATLKHLESIGEEIGLIFQITDDLLGVFGKTSQTGKPVGNDIREKKKTFMFARLFGQLPPQEQAQCRTIMAKKTLDDADIQTIMHWYDTYDIKATMKREMETMVPRITAHISKLPWNEENKQALGDLLHLIIQRTT